MNDLNVKSIYCISTFLVIYINNGDEFTSDFINNKCNSKTLTLLMNDNNINTIWLGINNLFIYKNNGDSLISDFICGETVFDRNFILSLKGLYKYI